MTIHTPNQNSASSSTLEDLIQLQILGYIETNTRRGLSSAEREMQRAAEARAHAAAIER